MNNAEQLQIDRRRKLLEAMQAQAMSYQPQMVGGRMTKYSPIRGGMDLLTQAILAHKQSKLNERERELASEQEQSTADAIGEVMKTMEGYEQPVVSPDIQVGGPQAPLQAAQRPETMMPERPPQAPLQAAQTEGPLANVPIPGDPAKAMMTAAFDPRLKGAQNVISALAKSKMPSKLGYTYFPSSDPTKLVGVSRTDPEDVRQIDVPSGIHKTDPEAQRRMEESKELGKLEARLEKEPQIAYENALRQGLGEEAAQKIIDKPLEEYRMTSKRQKNFAISAKIKDAINRSEWWNTGPMAQMFGWVGGTEIYDLGKLLTSMKAELGLDALNTLKKETGAGLGPVTEAEHELLQSKIASLDQAQSEAQLDKNLQDIQDTIDQVLANDTSMHEKKYGGEAAKSSTEDEPPPGVDPEDWKFMPDEYKAVFR